MVGLSLLPGPLPHSGSCVLIECEQRGQSATSSQSALLAWGSQGRACSRVNLLPALDPRPSGASASPQASALCPPPPPPPPPKPSVIPQSPLGLCVRPVWAWQDGARRRACLSVRLQANQRARPSLHQLTVNTEGTEWTAPFSLPQKVHRDLQTEPRPASPA